MSIIGKWINAFITLGAIATFAVADVTIEGRALAQGATLIPLGRIRARNATLRRSEAVVQEARRHKRATAKAAPPESKATFKVLTGKLKIDVRRSSALFCSKGAKRTWRGSFDHLVSAGEQRGWHHQTEHLGGFEIDHQLERGALLWRTVWSSSFDDFVGASEHWGRNVNAKLLRRLEVNSQLEPGGEFNWELRRLCTFEDFIGIACSMVPHRGSVGTVRHQSPGVRELFEFAHHGQVLSHSQIDDPSTLRLNEYVIQRDECLRALLRCILDVSFEIARCPHRERLELNLEGRRDSLNPLGLQVLAGVIWVPQHCHLNEVWKNFFKKLQSFFALFSCVKAHAGKVTTRA